NRQEIPCPILPNALERRCLLVRYGDDDKIIRGHRFGDAVQPGEPAYAGATPTGPEIQDNEPISKLADGNGSGFTCFSIYPLMQGAVEGFRDTVADIHTYRRKHVTAI